MHKKKVVLAYSGGLDTSIIIPWLIENYNCEVIAVVGDVGQADDFYAIKQKAFSSGASSVLVLNLKEEFVRDYIYPTLQAGAIYEGKYMLGTSFARPLIAKKLVEIAKEKNATSIAHGCTGKGNDQVRFELAIKAFAPHMKIIAPWRIWNIKSREDAIDYAEEKAISIPVTKKDNYSRDKNLWHVSHEGSDLENPWNEPPYENLLQMSVTPESAPDKPLPLEIDFVNGLPQKINGEEYSPVDLIRKLNELGGIHGIGIADIVENRLVGMKSRGVYETPGGTILYFAHNELERICLDKETFHYKELVAHQFASLVYNGQWFTPLREALSAFVHSTQKNVTGRVKLKLYKGNLILSGLNSSHSLYDEDLSSFGAEEVYNQKDAEGFINLFGLPIKVQGMLNHTKK
jgi:argininosuccinate synthase